MDVPISQGKDYFYTMDDALISTVYTKRATPRVHEKLFKFFYSQIELEC